MADKMLITTDQVKPMEIFIEGKYDGLLEFIVKESTIENPTVKTTKGRALIRSTAASIASSKVFVEKARKKLADNERAKIDKTLSAILESGNYIKDCLVYHQAVVREPLTKYEAEKKAEEDEQAYQNGIVEKHVIALGENAEFDRLKKIEAENEKLKKEAIEREAEDKARIKIEGEQKEKNDSETRKLLEAEQETERLKQKSINDEKQAEIDKQKAVDDEGKRVQAEADEKERRRIADDETKRKADEAKSADVAHQKRINNEALPGLIEILGDEATAKKVLVAIITGKVKHVRVCY